MGMASAVFDRGESVETVKPAWFEIAGGEVRRAATWFLSPGIAGLQNHLFG
jgi:hypothetical protein